MTFTEAAVEVLRRAGKPLHYKDIAELALKDNLLSHAGQDPEVTMGQRLAAMAKREEDRKVVAIAPDGTFALPERGVPQELIVEPVPPDRLGDYLRDFRKLLERYDYRGASLYGHFGQGCVHTRIPFELRTDEGIAMMQAVCAPGKEKYFWRA